MTGTAAPSILRREFKPMNKLAKATIATGRFAAFKSRRSNA